MEGEKESYFSCYPPCTVSPELRPEYVDENLLRFVCYAAVCHTVYGISCESVTTKHLLGLVSQLRPDMVKELKTSGSGKLPPNIQKRKTKHLTASANDAFATIRITARDCTEGCCDEALSYLVAGRRSSTCPSPACPRRASINSLPARCGTPASMCRWRIMPGLPCGRTSGIKTSPMRSAPCLAPSPCSLWG